MYNSKELSHITNMQRIDAILHDEKFCYGLERIVALEHDRIFCRHDLSHLLDVARIAWIMVLENNLDIKKDIVKILGKDMASYSPCYPRSTLISS